MKTNYWIALGFLLFLFSCDGGGEKEEKLSPFAKDALQVQKTDLGIAYSSPQKRGRQIWGDLVPYGTIWRTGADEATVFETSTPVRIKGDTLPAGKYSLFTIPEKEEWTVVFNETWEQWGAFNYEEAKDVMRVTVIPAEADSVVEGLVLQFETVDDTTAHLQMAWDELAWELPLIVPVPPEK